MDIGTKSGAAKFAPENGALDYGQGCVISMRACCVCCRCSFADAVWLRVLTDLISSALTNINTPLSISSKMALTVAMKMALKPALKTKVN